MAVSKITNKGKTTIPEEIRRHLRLRAGDRIQFIVEGGGKVVLIPAAVDASELKGLLAPAPRWVSLKVMDATIRRRAGAR